MGVVVVVVVVVVDVVDDAAVVDVDVANSNFAVVNNSNSVGVVGVVSFFDCY